MLNLVAPDRGVADQARNEQQILIARHIPSRNWIAAETITTILLCQKYILLILSI
jgi:hypothetical protein